MKNIFILPTQQEFNYETNFIMSCVKEFTLFGKTYRVGDILEESAFEADKKYWQPNFIYITNEEELTLNGYHFNSKYGDEPQKTNQRDIDSKKYWEEEDYYIIKIILTNDPKLIVDGIQELTEEQLKQIVSRYPLDYVEVKREEDGQFIEYSADGSVEKGVYENYSICFNSFFAEKIESSRTEDSKILREFELINGCKLEDFDAKDWIKFERFVERREKENKEDFNNKDNWEFERSSGYAGYRNEMTGDWIYEKEYLEKFGEEKDKTAEKENYRRVFTQENGWQDEIVYTEEEVRGILIKFHNEFPDRWDIDKWFNKL